MAARRRRRSTRSSTSSRTCASPRASSSATSRAGSACSTARGCAPRRTALLERLDHGDIQPGHVRAHAAPRRAAGRLDRPRAVAQRQAADHGRAVRDPRRRRGRDRCSASSAGSPPTASASSTSRTASTRSRASATASRCSPTARTVATGLPADTPRGELVEKMVGRKVDQLYPDRATATSDDVVLDVRGVSRVAARAASAASRSARARSSASAGSSAPGAPSCCG